MKYKHLRILIIVLFPISISLGVVYGICLIIFALIHTFFKKALELKKNAKKQKTIIKK